MSDLRQRIQGMFSELQVDGYEGKHDGVLDIIATARRDLTFADGQPGPWEAEELAYAETAVRTNFLMLALNAVEKAIAVSQLPREDYEYGFNYTKRNRT